MILLLLDAASCCWLLLVLLLLLVLVLLLLLPPDRVCKCRGDVLDGKYRTCSWCIETSMTHCPSLRVVFRT